MFVCRLQDEQLAAGRQSGAGHDHHRGLPVLRVELGAPLHGPPETLQAHQHSLLLQHIPDYRQRISLLGGKVCTVNSTVFLIRTPLYINFIYISLLRWPD